MCAQTNWIYLPLVWIIKPLQELYCGAFPAAACTNQGHCLPNIDGQVKAFQNLEIWEKINTAETTHLSLNVSTAR